MLAILNTGIHDDMAEDIQRKIILCNGMALLISFGIALPFSIVSLIYFPNIAFLPIACIVFCMLMIGVNKLGMYNLSRSVIGLNPFILTVFFSAYLTPAGQPTIASIFALEICFAVVPFILFDFSEWKYQLSSGLFILIVAAFLTDTINATFEKEVDATVIKEGFMFNVSIITALLVSCGGTVFMSYNNFVVNQRQVGLLNEMDEKNQVLKRSEMKMKENLKEIEKNQVREKQQNWITEGIADFGNLLRDNDDTEAMYDKLISGITKYMDANQSALFIVRYDKDGEAVLRLQACYAYSRKKFMEKAIIPGEGLLGQAYFEKDIVHLTNVPEDYVTISSGLGGARPKAIIIVPLINNEEVTGILEIASFEKFEEYQIDFLKRLTENIASYINMYQINEKTAKLLEESQVQAEAMRSQEEEIRQNMEELMSTQEELARKEKDYLSKIADLEDRLKGKERLLDKGH